MVIDLGTSQIKVSVFNAEGQVLGAAQLAWQASATGDGSQPVVPGWLEFKPSELWQWIVLCVKRALDAALTITGRPAVREIRAIAVTSQRQGIVLLDQQRREICGIPNIDSRAREIATGLGTERGEEIYWIAGRWPGTVHPVSKLLWLQRHAASLFGQVGTVLSLADWVVFKLTGKTVTDPTLACETCLFDVETVRWSERLCSELGLNPSIFPEVAGTGKAVGCLSRHSPGAVELRECGFELSETRESQESSVMVVLGGADTQCGVLGSGVVRPGSFSIVAGTSAPVQTVTSQPVFDARFRTITNAFLLPGRWVLESNAMMTGFSWAWLAGLLEEALALYPEFRETAGKNPDFRPYEVLETLAKRAPLGAEGVLTVLGVGVMNSRRGSIPLQSGILMPWSGVSTRRIGLAEIARSVLEASCFAIRANVEQLKEICSTTAQVTDSFGCSGKIRVGGGSARSTLWTRTLADVIGEPLQVSENHDITGLGCAMSGFVALGVYRNFEEAAARMCRVRIQESDSEAHSIYEPIYVRWLNYLDLLHGADSSIRQQIQVNRKDSAI